MSRVDPARIVNRSGNGLDLGYEAQTPPREQQAPNARSHQSVGCERTARSPRRRTTILAFGAYDWDAYWQTRQQVLSRLGSRGWRVGYTTPAMSIWERNGLRWRDSAWRSRAVDRDGVHIRYPGRLPALLHKLESWDRMIKRRHARVFASSLA